MSHSSELRAHLEVGIAELEADLDRLRRALAALDGGEAAPAARSSRGRPQASRAVRPQALLDVLAEGQGTTSAELARLQGAPQARVLAVLKELEAEGRVRRTGRRRGTRWFGLSGPAPEAAGESTEAPPPAEKSIEAPRPAAEPAEASHPTRAAQEQPDTADPEQPGGAEAGESEADEASETASANPGESAAAVPDETADRRRRALDPVLAD